MNDTSWFLILFAFSTLGIAGYFVLHYANKYWGLKERIHLAHQCIESMDIMLDDDEITREEILNIIKRCTALLKSLV